VDYKEWMVSSCSARSLQAFSYRPRTCMSFIAYDFRFSLICMPYTKPFNLQFVAKHNTMSVNIDFLCLYFEIAG
jgi:hypothetical protein